MSKLIAAAIQMTSSADVSDNLAQAESWLEQAAHYGAELMVLPECFGYFGEGGSQQHHEYLGRQGPIQNALSRWSKAYSAWVVGGTLALRSDLTSTKSAAACLVYDAFGKLKATYHKMHLFDACIGSDKPYKESSYTQPGSCIVVCQLPSAKMGVSVCYDLRFPELYRQQSQSQARILVVVAAFTHATGKAHWLTLLKARAIENLCYVVAANQAGTHSNGRQSFGHSVIISPWGEVLTEAPEDKPGLVTAELDFVEQDRMRASLPCLTHRRILHENP